MNEGGHTCGNCGAELPQRFRHARMIAEFKANNVFDFAILSLVTAGVGELLPTKTATEDS